MINNLYWVMPTIISVIFGIFDICFNTAVLVWLMCIIIIGISPFVYAHLIIKRKYKGFDLVKSVSFSVLCMFINACIVEPDSVLQYLNMKKFENHDIDFWPFVFCIPLIEFIATLLFARMTDKIKSSGIDSRVKSTILWSAPSLIFIIFAFYKACCNSADLNMILVIIAFLVFCLFIAGIFFAPYGYVYLIEKNKHKGIVRLKSMCLSILLICLNSIIVSYDSILYFLNTGNWTNGINLFLPCVIIQVIVFLLSIVIVKIKFYCYRISKRKRQL